MVKIEHLDPDGHPKSRLIDFLFFRPKLTFENGGDMIPLEKQDAISIINHVEGCDICQPYVEKIAETWTDSQGLGYAELVARARSNEFLRLTTRPE